MHRDTEACVRAVQAKDTRFDGTFITAVTTTGIYCRPSCPAMTPRPEHMRFYPSAAAAQRDGYRACKRCRPDASPGSPEWDVRGDAVGRAMRLIGDGVVDRDGVPGLADRLGWSVRQVQRMLQAELGAGPLALARAQRAQTARVLLETTDLPVTDVALTAGFGSLRAFNETVQQVFAATPTQLRASAQRSDRTDARRAAGSGVTVSNPSSLGGHDVACSTPKGGGAHSGLVALDLRLPFRPPLHPDTVFGHLAATAVPGVEEWRDGAYRRTLRLPHAWGIASLRPPAPGVRHVDCRLLLADLRDLTAATARVRWLLDLDADPVAVDAALGEDPALAPFVDARPGIRVPRTVDGPELAIRAVLGQQVSTAAARTHAARLVLAHGTAITDPEGGLTHL
ncbi:MAG: bifunctional transcriptional activator/DNA repair enzyme AdaA, partial [Actinomycetes bacterium]